jgi:Cft2 family RNA processing exonuclease
MELYIAGGVGEHGRNCFLVQGETIRFLVDCGKMADDPEQPYPHLTEEQIHTLDAVFLTHSHADHTGALPWLYENGFQGEVIATEETLHQLPFAVKKSVYLGKICCKGVGSYHAMNICWGRTGHCAGSVWLRFETEGKRIFFSGDYTENTLAYACDPIRNQTADLAVLDCAYGKDTTTYDAWCGQLVHAVEEILQTNRLTLLPVPKFGRGLLRISGTLSSSKM